MPIRGSGIILVLAALLAGCAASRTPAGFPCFTASAWPDADALFRRDPHWVGGDGTSSLDLGDGRILWLFGDSWIDPSGRRSRRGARMVSNTVAIQSGQDPTDADIRFFWRRAADGRPEAFVPDDGDEKHWFGNAFWVDDRLVLFLSRTRSTDSGLGFESLGWAAWMVDNPDEEPSLWRMHRLDTPSNPLGVLVGFATVLREGEHVVAIGSRDPVPTHPIHAVRWSVEQVRAGRLLEPEWWGGETRGWIPDSLSRQSRPLFDDGQSAVTLHRDPETGQYLAAQTRGFGPADVVLRAAPALTGPWSQPSFVYRPPEFDRPGVMIYSARAHPELTGADLALTYDTNTFEFAEQLADSTIYYPSFVRLTRCR